MNDVAIILQERAGFSAAVQLTSELRERLQAPVIIDASAVEHISAPCLEVLLSASESWAKCAVNFQIANPSDAFCDGINRMGVSLSELEISVN